MRSGLTGSRSATLRRLALLKRWCRAAVTGRMRPCRPEAPIRVVSLDMNVGYGRQPVAAAGHPPPLRRSLVGDGQYSDRRTGVFMGNGVGPPVRSGGQFVGRQAESALVGLTIDPASIGAPTSLVVRGEPGIGKTRLLGAAGASAPVCKAGVAAARAVIAGAADSAASPRPRGPRSCGTIPRTLVEA